MYTGEETETGPEAEEAEPGLGRIRAPAEEPVTAAPAGIIFMPAGASLSWMVVAEEEEEEEADLGCCCWMTAAAVGRDFDVATEAADITRCRLAAD